MCKWYCTSTGPNTNLTCVNCGSHYCSACLHGEAGKMTSLLKCASCGLKPTVKSDGMRTGWTSVCNPPCNEGGGPRYDGDEGRANSAFTSGSRGSQSHQRTRSMSKPSTPGQGPERFFYDKSTYTGTHAKGGPDHVAKGEGTVGHYVPTIMSNSRRAAPAASITTTAPPVAAGDDERVRMECFACGYKCVPQWLNDEAHCLKCQAVLRRRPNGARRPPSRPGSRGAGAATYVPRPPSRGAGSVGRVSRQSSLGRLAGVSAAAPPPAASRPSSRGAGSAGRVLRGPERFFYDKSSYTGTHTRGGPSSVPKGGGTSIDQTWKRPF